LQADSCKIRRPRKKFTQKPCQAFFSFLATFFRGRAVTTEVKHLLWISGGDLDENCPIPKFVLTYIENLPECYLFQGFGSLGQGLLYLCEYGFEHPLDIEALLEQVAAKEDAGLYVAFAEDRRNNLLVRPVPLMLGKA
jgi:hypothetical protein